MILVILAIVYALVALPIALAGIIAFCDDLSAGCDEKTLRDDARHALGGLLWPLVALYLLIRYGGRFIRAADIPGLFRKEPRA